MTWLPKPRYAPFVCGITNLGDTAQGPYYETQFHYHPYSDDGTHDDRVMRLTLSRAFLKNITSEGDSPVVIMDKSEYQDMLERDHLLTAKCAEQDEVIESMAAELIDQDVKKNFAKSVLEEYVASQKASSPRRKAATK